MTLQNDLAAAVSSTRAMYGAAACSCALTSDDGASLRFVAADGQGSDAIIGVELAANEGIVGWVAMSGQPLAVADVSRDQRFARHVAEATDYVPTSILAAPLVDDEGDTIGVVEVLDPSRSGEASLGGQRGTGAELAVLAVVASHLARMVLLAGRLDTARDATVDPDLLDAVQAVPPDRVDLALALLRAAADHGTPRG